MTMIRATVFVLAFFGVSATAAAREVTPELLTVRTVANVLEWSADQPDFRLADISDVTAASSTRSAISITILLNYTNASGGSCEFLDWFDFEGNRVACDACRDDDACACASASCELSDGTVKQLKRK